MEKKFLIPGEGLKVIDPKTMKPLPAEGASIEMTIYWHRRIKDGDVTVGTAPAQAAASPASADSSKKSSTKKEG